MLKHQTNRRWQQLPGWICQLLIAAVLAACSLPGASQPTAPATSTSTWTALPVLSTTSAEAVTPTEPTLTLTYTPEPSPTATATGTATLEPTPSPVPTYAILRGVVNVEKVSCRYGPGAMYLYLYGMVKGAVQDVLARTDSGAWVLTRSHGDNKSCWVKAEYLDLNGDVMSLEMVYPDKYTLPPSNQGYRPPWNVVAIRHGEDVVISWDSEDRRPGDEESDTSVLYVVETWVCRDGQLWFTPIGSFTRQVTVKDEAGCQEPSHGRVYFVEKHGYTGPTVITWPQAQ